MGEQRVLRLRPGTEVKVEGYGFFCAPRLGLGESVLTLRPTDDPLDLGWYFETTQGMLIPITVDNIWPGKRDLFLADPNTREVLLREIEHLIFLMGLGLRGVVVTCTNTRMPYMATEELLEKCMGQWETTDTVLYPPPCFGFIMHYPDDALARRFAEYRYGETGKPGVLEIHIQYPRDDLRTYTFPCTSEGVRDMTQGRPLGRPTIMQMVARLTTAVLRWPHANKVVWHGDSGWELQVARHKALDALGILSLAIGLEHSLGGVVYRSHKASHRLDFGLAQMLTRCLKRVSGWSAI